MNHQHSGLPPTLKRMIVTPVIDLLIHNVIFFLAIIDVSTLAILIPTCIPTESPLYEDEVPHYTGLCLH